MTRWARLWQHLVGQWPKAAPIPPARRPRVVCEFCGKSVAVVASSGALWKHHCRPVEDEAPADALQHDTWDEHRGLR